MAGTVTPLELRWGELFSPIPRHSAGKEWPRNHRGKPRHRISGSHAVIVVVGLRVRLRRGALQLGFGLLLWRESCRNPEERGVGYPTVCQLWARAR